MLKHKVTETAKSASQYGFVPSTLILTPEGAKFIEDLTPGDMVLTRDHGPQPLRALHQALSPARAITIAPEAIGPGLPWRHLRLAPAQRIAVKGWKAGMLFGVNDLLVPVGDLVSNEAMLARTVIGATVIFEPVFDEPQVIFAEGIAVEAAAFKRPALHLPAANMPWPTTQLQR